MDSSARIIAFVGTRNPGRAKEFYRDTLGLNLVSEDHFAIVFDVHGTMLRVTHGSGIGAGEVHGAWAGR